MSLPVRPSETLLSLCLSLCLSLPPSLSLARARGLSLSLSLSLSLARSLAQLLSSSQQSVFRDWHNFLLREGRFDESELLFAKALLAQSQVDEEVGDLHRAIDAAAHSQRVAAAAATAALAGQDNHRSSSSGMAVKLQRHVTVCHHELR